MPTPLIRLLEDPAFADLIAQIIEQIQHSPQPLQEYLQSCRDRIEAYYTAQPAYALRLAQRFHDLCLRLPLPAASLGLWVLGEASLHNGHYVASAQQLAAAREAYERANQRVEAARVTVGYIAALAYTGQLSLARQCAQACEVILLQSAKQHSPDVRVLMRFYTHLALVYELMGDYEATLALYDQQLPTLIGLGDANLLARANMHRAAILTRVGAIEEAMTAYDQAEMLLYTLESDAFHPALSQLLSQRLTLLLAAGRYEEAQVVQTYVQHLFSTMEGMEQASHRFTLLRTQLIFATPNPAEWTTEPGLLEALQQAQQWFLTHGPLMDEGLAAFLLGRYYTYSANLPLAQKFYQRSLVLARRSGERSLELRILHALSTLERTLGRSEQAIIHLQSALDAMEQMRYALQVERFRIALLREHLPHYHELAELYLAQGAHEHAFAVVERAKSRLISEKLASRLQEEVRQVADSPNEEVRLLAHRLQATLQQLEQTQQRDLSGAPAKFLEGSRFVTGAPDRSFLDGEMAFDEEQSSITALEHLVHSLILQIQYQQAAFSPFTSGQVIDLAQMQAGLGDALFLQYHLLHDRYFVFVVDRHAIRAHLELASLAQVAQAQRAFVASIERMLGLLGQLGAARLLQRLPALIEDANKQLSALYRLLFAPLQPSIPVETELILSPDGALHALPFHAFFDGRDYLLARHPIRYVPSATVLDYCVNRPMPTHVPASILLFGYDDGRLASVAREVQTVAQLYPDALVVTGQQATTQTFLAQVPQTRIAHIAAHATFRRDRPMLSSITLADRRLSLAEIAQLRLDAELIGLSGCETGQGEADGSDLLSLASGFLGAGARALLVSLWRVEDQSTALLMQHFYQSIQQGARLVTALREAQLALLKHGRETSGFQALYRHPAFWSPFVLVGDGGRRVS